MKTAVFACVLFLALSVSLLGLSQEMRSTEELQNAATLLRDKQFPAAVQAYQKILKAEPRNEKASLGLAAAYYGVYNYDQMRRVLRQTAAAHPGSAAALVELGKLDIHLQHYDDAIVELQRAVRRDRSFAAAHEQLGVAYQAKGDEQRALTEFNEAIRIAPTAASTHYFRGTLYADRNDDDRAYQDAKAAYRLTPNTQTRELLGKTALHANKCEEAVDVLRPLAELEEPVPEDLYLLSRACKCAGQTERAQKLQADYETQSKKVQDAKTHKMKADHLATNAGEMARNNQLAQVLDLLQQALAEDPDNGPSLALMSKIDFSRGDMGKAQDEISRALSGDPYNPDYLYVQGKVLESSDPRAALQAFQQVILVNPDESDAYYEMSQIYLRLGERTRALDALRKAVQLSPEDADYKKALAELKGKTAR